MNGKVRQAKKLVLNKVTLRRLSSNDLKLVAGGFEGPDCNNPPDGDTNDCFYHEQPSEGF